ncbi:pyrroline-5-carboxylate reductase [Pinirhizobacter soli]|uniref:pyrroline-5-carboxylate reductase n=1 Tax=Pinirhizobacter soli TaxID=2786953 RepID=UPI00202A4338|nr:pyrroline-5-carboxylate reductase [Pinirhizobacter soli]
MTRIAFIGGGNMARSLIGGVLRHGGHAGSISVAEPRAYSCQELAREFGVATYPQNVLAAEGADMLVLAVKPQVMPAVCKELKHVVARSRPLVVSIAAGIRIAQIERWLGGPQAVVRCMPNTPALIGAGATGLFANGRVGAPQRALAQHLLDSAGLTTWVPQEEELDVVTAISGSGPAYFFLLAEALEAAGVAQGLSPETARALAAQTALGAGRMLTEGSEPAATLRERVTSPNGTTQAALESFAMDHFNLIVERAVDAATRRAEAMSAAMDAES